MSRARWAGTFSVAEHGQQRDHRTANYAERVFGSRGGKVQPLLIDLSVASSGAGVGSAQPMEEVLKVAEMHVEHLQSLRDVLERRLACMDSAEHLQARLEEAKARRGRAAKAVAALADGRCSPGPKCSLAPAMEIGSGAGTRTAWHRRECDSPGDDACGELCLWRGEPSCQEERLSHDLRTSLPDDANVFQHHQHGPGGIQPEVHEGCLHADRERVLVACEQRDTPNRRSLPLTCSPVRPSQAGPGPAAWSAFHLSHRSSESRSRDLNGWCGEEEHTSTSVHEVLTPLCDAEAHSQLRLEPLFDSMDFPNAAEGIEEVFRAISGARHRRTQNALALTSSASCPCLGDTSHETEKPTQSQSCLPVGVTSLLSATQLSISERRCYGSTAHVCASEAALAAVSSSSSDDDDYPSMEVLWREEMAKRAAQRKTSLMLTSSSSSDSCADWADMFRMPIDSHVRPERTVKVSPTEQTANVPLPAFRAGSSSSDTSVESFVTLWRKNCHS